jgi:hypothetical protein
MDVLKVKPDMHFYHSFYIYIFKSLFKRVFFSYNLVYEQSNSKRYLFKKN